MKKFFYRVQKGDSILSISNRFLVPFYDLIAKNNLKAEVQAGDLLVIECPNSVYKVKPMQTYFDIAKEVGKTGEQLKILNANLTYLFYGIIINV